MRRARTLPGAPEWDGSSSLDGKTILLYADPDGHGDAFMMVRFCPAVKAMGETVVLSCPESQAYVLAECEGIDRVVIDGAKRSPDVVPRDVQAH
jgi:hypothetical protein